MVVHHVGYLTKDLDKAIKAFEQLGFYKETKIIHDQDRKINICFLISECEVYNKGEGYRAELIQPTGIESPMYPLLKRYKNVPYHFCFLTKNIDITIENLVKDGYKVIQEPLAAPALENRKVCFLIGDASGIIELLEE